MLVQRVWKSNSTIEINVASKCKKLILLKRLKTCDDQGQFSTLKINAKFREVFNSNFAKNCCVLDPDKGKQKCFFFNLPGKMLLLGLSSNE